MEGAGVAATCTNANQLARWLSADWGNMAQSQESPNFWSHIHVVFRPLGWDFFPGGSYCFFSESAYDYNLGSPYKCAVYRLIEAEGGIELECYKMLPEYSQEYWMGSHEPSILEQLRVEHLSRMDDACNTIYKYDAVKNMYTGGCRPGNKCVVQRAGRGPLAYIDSTLTLQEHRYTAWDLGRDPETHERLWGTPAGPFDFVRVKDLAHLVPFGEKIDNIK